MKTYIECQICGSCINVDTGSDYIPCACGAIAVDGNKYYTRIIGQPEHWQYVTFLAKAMHDHDFVKGFAEVRRYISAGSITINDELATAWNQTVKTGDIIKLGKHKSFCV